MPLNEVSQKKRLGARKLKYPRRIPSLAKSSSTLLFRTADKTTCQDCICFPKDTYVVHKKLIPCLVTPKTLYELAAAVVDQLPLPVALTWSIIKVADWMSNVVGLPQYRECITKNKIDGHRLILLEDPSNLTKINIHDFEHMKAITASIRSIYGLDFILFSRSHGLPPRRPLIHTVIFKSLTGPPEGIRVNWSRTDVLRWMKVLDPEPRIMNHWDLVWYQRPDYPRSKFARVGAGGPRENIPHYLAKPSDCREYLTPRKFFLREEVEPTLIWMEHRPGSPLPDLFKAEKAEEKRRQQGKRKEFTRFDRKPIKLDGLSSRAYMLARRQMPKQKF